MYWPRHPERTVLYRVLFHYFDQFLAEYEEHFEREYGFLRPIIKEIVERYLDCGNPRCGWAEMICKVYEVNPMACPKCQAEMRIIAFITDYAVVDRIRNHLKLTFVAERPPPPHLVSQEFFLDSEASADYFS